MNQQKGFSLTEVLIALSLVTFLILALSEHQSQSRQMLIQLLMRTQASHLLDQFEESALAQIKKIPSLPAPFHLEIHHKHQEVMIKVAWQDQLGVMSRIHSPYKQN